MKSQMYEWAVITTMMIVTFITRATNECAAADDDNIRLVW